MVSVARLMSQARHWREHLLLSETCVLRLWCHNIHNYTDMIQGPNRDINIKHRYV